MTTKAELRWLARIAQLPCGTCGQSPVQVHHIRTGQGMSQRASHFLAIPLCPSCHTGKHGIHGDRAMFKIKNLTELDVLANTIEILA